MILSDSTYLSYQATLRKYIDENVYWRANPDVLYTEGLKPGNIIGGPYKENNTVQFYSRRLTHNVEMCRIACAMIGDHISCDIADGEEVGEFQFAGLETGSIPLITGLQFYFNSLGTPINAFIVRKERKPYGLFNLIEGIPNDLPVMYIDDLINAGTSGRRVYDAAKYELGLEPTRNAYSIIQMRGGWIGNIAIRPIFKHEEFDKTYSPEKYWLPKDCQKEINTRPDYK